MDCLWVMYRDMPQPRYEFLPAGLTEVNSISGHFLSYSVWKSKLSKSATSSLRSYPSRMPSPISCPTPFLLIDRCQQVDFLADLLLHVAWAVVVGFGPISTGLRVDEVGTNQPKPLYIDLKFLRLPFFLLKVTDKGQPCHFTPAVRLAVVYSTISKVVPPLYHPASHSVCYSRILLMSCCQKVLFPSVVCLYFLAHYYCRTFRPHGQTYWCSSSSSSFLSFTYSVLCIPNTR